MIKETKITKEVVERQKFCDVCGNEIVIGLRCSVATCGWCKKDLCSECVGHEDETCGDYRVVYCEQCWKISEPYRKVIGELHSLIDDLYSDCRQEIKDQSGT